MINCFLRNLIYSIPSDVSHGLICLDALVGEYSKVYICTPIYLGFGIL